MKIREGRTPRVLLGFAVALALCVVVVAPFARPRRSPMPGAPAPSLALLQAREAQRRADAVAVATSLASTLTELNRLKSLREGGIDQARPPPPASSFASETECLASFLPSLSPIEPEKLEFVCKQSDLWAIERQAHVLMAGKPGKAAELWNRLGSHSLAALATMRSGCCIDAEPLTAVVPGLWCGILRDKVRLFSALPEPTTVEDFERTMRCLGRRGARFPAHFTTLPAGRGERAFEEFLSIARARG